LTSKIETTRKKRSKANGEGTIYCEQRAKGTYYKATLTMGYDEYGKPIRLSTGSYSKKEVIQWLQEMATKKNSNSFSKNTKITLSEWFYTWLYTFQINELKPSTFERYDGLYRNYIKDTDIGNKPLSKLTGIQLQHYYNSLFALGTSVDTIANINNRIKTSLNQAIKLDYISKNPCLAVKLPRKDHNPDKLVNAFTPAEQQTFLKVNEFHRYSALFCLAFGGGLRLGEILALTWSNVNFSKNTITVRATVSQRTQIDASGQRTWKFIVTAPKTVSSYRTIPIPINVMNKLKQHQFKQNLEKQEMGDLYEDNDLVFATNIGGYISTRNFTRSYERAIKKADIPYKSFHATRHTYATRLFELGVPSKTVQTLLGHSKVSTTMDIYTHVIPEKQYEGIDKINHLFDFNI